MNEHIYPDVLGELSSERLTVQDVLQCALGVFPTATTLGQPVEVLLLLQNLIDQPLVLQLAIRTPSKDVQGNLINLFTPRPRIQFTLPAGESGLFYLPVIPQLPTTIGDGYPVRVQVAVQKPDQFVAVRSPSPGPPPNMLSISPFRMAVLRDIHFSAAAEGSDSLDVTFDILAGQVPMPTNEIKPRYEALWTVRNLEQELDKIKAMSGEAQRFANSFTREHIHALLLKHTKDFFGEADMPLHPGEALFITKIMTYVFEDGLSLEAGFSLEGSRWFQQLCRLILYNPAATKNLDGLLKLLYLDALYDAILLGFSIVEHDAKEEFGDKQEQIEYATKAVAALRGQIPMGLEYVYVPLILAGTILAPRVTAINENPWHSIASLKEARDGRTSLAGGAFHEVFDILNTLIAKTERFLWETKVPRN